MNKKLGCALILSCLILIGVGCAQKPVSQSGSNEPAVQGGQTQSPNPSETKVDLGTMNTQVVDVYLADSQVLALEKTEQEIEYKDDSEKYEKTFAALQTNTDSELVSLWEQVELLSIQYAEGTVTLDVHIPAEANLGTSGELLALEALTTTMFQFDEVNSLDILVDGEAVDSLMGHAELEHPIHREP
ncbi:MULTISPECIES: GerMN domain-containing protein [Paenibacillus]|uniref:GerMN domain-containing protein n=1 Tax=Paenibacillus TaxID=44249 RepID=UPI000B83143C|nr:GerMN domain-containing protein [Paenibacillus amylolyticus]